MSKEINQLLVQALEGQEFENISDIDYVKSLKIKKEDGEETVLKVLKKYGKNKWWLCKNNEIKAFGQLFEPILIMNFGDFQEYANELLDRPVFTHEFGLSMDSLKRSAEEKITTKYNLQAELGEGPDA